MKDTTWLSDFSKKVDENCKLTTDYALIDSLVHKYQSGDKDSAEELLKQMTPYLLKFFKIIRLGTIDLVDKDSRRFVGLFSENKEFALEACGDAIKMASIIQSICGPIPTDDLVQELAEILLMLAKRYEEKDGESNFCGYVCNSFRFELFRRIIGMTSDTITRYSISSISYNDSECVEEVATIYINEPLEKLEEELGNSWIKGLTCNELFGKLTQAQRVILKMYYIDGEGDTGIADSLGMSRSTIKKMRLKAEETLRIAKDDSDASEEKRN